MVKKPVMVLDLDSVVVDFDDAIERHMHAMGYTGYRNNRVLTYDFNKYLKNPPEWLKSTTSCGNYYLNANIEDIRSLFTDVSFFESCKIYDGLEEKIKLASELYDIHFHSCACSKAVAEQKFDFVETAFSDMLHCVSITLGLYKPAFFGADVVVEDSPFALRQYRNTDTQRILTDKPYNQLEYNEAYMGDYIGVTRVESLSNYLDRLIGVNVEYAKSV